MCVRQAMEKKLEETNARWDEERQTMSHSADQANKVSVGRHGDDALIQTSLL